ncbi:MAG: hypothetical protein PVJ98_01340 [Akkermansiaceae bacterium]|jgi:hypothetical protein
MKLKHGAGLTGALCMLVSGSLDAAIINIGSGPDVSYFTVESPNVGVRQYAISYDAAADLPAGGTFLLNLIDAEDPEITFVINNFGSPAQPNEFFSSLTFNGITESNDFSPGGSTFGQWVAGGQAGAAGLGIPAPVPVSETNWTFGSGLSVNYRLIEPGSNGALVYAPGGTVEPSVNPIPEPSPVFLASLGLALSASRRRRR